MNKPTALRMAMRSYVTLLSTPTSISAYPHHRFTRYINIHYHMVLGRQRTGVDGAWFISNAHERQKQHEHAVFDTSCVVFNSVYEYKSAMHRCIGREYMI